MSAESTTSTTSNSLKHTLRDYSLDGLIGWLDSAQQYGVRIELRPLSGERVAIILHQARLVAGDEGNWMLRSTAEPHSGQLPISPHE